MNYLCFEWNTFYIFLVDAIEFILKLESKSWNNSTILLVSNFKKFMSKLSNQSIMEHAHVWFYTEGAFGLSRNH